MNSNASATHGATLATAFAALAGSSGQALAAEECGPPEPGVEIVCSAENYDAAEDGNISYTDLPEGDFSIRLDEGLAVAYDRDATGDDVLATELIPGRRIYYTAVVAVPLDPAHTGNITLTSSADVTTTGFAARGYLAGRIGGPGELRLDLRGGSITTDGHYAHGIAAFHLGRGDIAASLRGTTIRGQGHHINGVALRHTGTGNIALDADGATVDVIGDNVRGIFTDHIGTGDSLATLRGGTVSVSGNEARALFGYHFGEGDNAFALHDAAVTASGDSSVGVHLFRAGLGDLTINAERARIDVTGARSRGIFSEHGATGDIQTTLRGGGVAVSGENPSALASIHYGTGSNALDLRDTAVTASGIHSLALVLEHHGSGDLTIEAEGARANATGTRSRGILAWHRHEGDVTAVLRDATLTTQGERAISIYAIHNSNGAVRVDAERTDFRADGNGARAINVSQFGNGDIDIDLRAASTVVAAGDADAVLAIGAFQAGAGDTNIRVEGGSVSAASDSGSVAVYAQHFADAEGDAVVDLADVTVTADGEGSAGVRVSHFGTRGNLSVRLRDTQIAAAGGTSVGILAGLGSGNGTIRIDIDGGAVVAEGEGAQGVYVGQFTQDTGAVTFAADVGTDGYRDQTVKVNARVRGGSGIGAGVSLAGGGRVEVGPGGSVGADSGVAIRAFGDGAALHVSAEFNGRSAGDVFDGDIRNDEGRTTLVVDGVTLHHGVSGATGALIPRGARDLTLVPGDTVLGRAFSAADFVEPLAPRAAVYETLPDFLFRLAAPAGRRHAPRPAGGNAGFEYGEGSIEAAGTTTGAAYDFGRSAAVLALSGSLGPRFGAWMELHHGEADAAVDSPTGAGSLDAVLRGYSAGAAWQGSNWYAGASLASEDYLLDIATARRGPLGAGIDARGRSLGIELGSTVPAGGAAAFTPRAWLTKAEVSAGSFTDTVDSAVSVPDTQRTVAGIGVAVRFMREWNGGRSLTFGGFADIEATSGDTETVVHVSGEPLAFETPSEGLSAGVSLNYRHRRFLLDASLFTRTASDTGAAEHGARLSVGGLF